MPPSSSSLSMVNAYLLRHAPAFLSALAACLCTFFAMVNIVSFTFLSTCVTNVSAQITELLCKVAVHRHQCCRCPTNGSTFSVDLSTACHHLDILFFSEVRCGTEFACFSTLHAGIYAALPFCVLKSRGTRHKGCGHSCYLQAVYRSYVSRI
jgi:hypothetical protein